MLQEHARRCGCKACEHSFEPAFAAIADTRVVREEPQTHWSAAPIGYPDQFGPNFTNSFRLRINTA
jgi:hypothetical protein